MSQYTPDTAIPRLEGLRVAVVAAEWNGHITSVLAQGAIDRLHTLGYTGADDAADLYHVPGSVELTFAASQLIETELYDAVIVVGVVIRGDTPHFDYVCQSVTQGVTALNADCTVPVIFCVLTVENEQQALDRAGGPAGHKGVEAAETAVKMVAFKRKVESL